MEHTPLTPTDFAAIDDLGDWRYVLGAIRADFRTGSFTAAAALVTAIAEIADVADHHPDIEIRYPDRVRVALTTHAIGEISVLDSEIARLISETARQSDAVADVATAQAIEIAIDTMDPDRIRPFWAAALGYREVSGSLVDPLRVGPELWFQTMDEPRPERNRFHLDVSVTHDVAEQRVAEVVAAGGTLVTDAHAKAYWVLADADGNECCICTWQDR